MRLMLFAALAFAMLVACGDDDTARRTPPASERTTASPATASPADIDATATPAPPPGTIAISHDAGVFYVEVAVTAAERSTGLLGRVSLPADGGMLFVLEAVRIPSFSMRGMLIPLDFLWLEEDGTVAEITTDVQPPPTGEPALRRYAPAVAVRYVLELNAGAAARAGIEAGDQLDFQVLVLRPAP